MDGAFFLIILGAYLTLKQWFDKGQLFELKVTVTHAEDSETVLAGCVKDQAELYGLIAKLRDIGMKLILVQSTAADDEGKTDPKR